MGHLIGKNMYFIKIIFHIIFIIKNLSNINASLKTTKHLDDLNFFCLFIFNAISSVNKTNRFLIDLLLNKRIEKVVW